MINQTLTTNIAHDSAFNQFVQPKSGYIIVPENNILPTDKSENKEEKSSKKGKKIVFTVLGVGFGTLALMKGTFSKGLSKCLSNWKFKLEQKIAKGGKFQNFYRSALNKIEKFMAKTESVNNLTSLKDVLFQKLMFGKDGSRKFTRNIHEWITNVFDKMSRKTVNSAYATTNKKFASLNEYIVILNEKLLTSSNDPKVQSAIKEISERMFTVNANLDKGFGINARNARLKQINESTDGLFDYFWNASFKDIKNFKSKNMWQTFIAEDYILPAKMKMSTETAALRSLITRDIDDLYKSTSTALENIQKFVDPSDITVNEALGKIRVNLTKYKNLSGTNESSQRLELNKEIVADLKSLSKLFKESESNYNEEAIAEISKYIVDVENVISNGQKGELQEILTLYKQILPRKDYLKLRAKVQSAIKSLDNSIEVETVKYFDKVRDLKLGSAPTDVLSIIGGVGTVSWFLGKSKDKDEKISASLKYGIPAIGAIATSLYSTAKLVSGGKSLLLGLLSGWVMSKAGDYIDKTRKKYTLDISLQNKTLIKPQPDKV